MNLVSDTLHRKTKNSKGRKGQIFTLDMLLAILGITIFMGLAVQYQTLVKEQASQASYMQMETMASDAAQIAVKRKISQEGTANVVEGPELEEFLEDFTGDNYEYETRGAIELNEDHCEGREQSSSKRMVDGGGYLQELTIIICK